MRVKCGCIARPVAMRAAMVHSDSGVSCKKPWPMPCTTVSPRFQAFPCFSRQARVGTSPLRAPGSSMSSGTPSPNLLAMAAMRSMPVRNATL